MELHSSQRLHQAAHAVMIVQRRDSNDEERDGAFKKPRVVWSVEMHQQFVNAVNQLGVDSKLTCWKPCPLLSSIVHPVYSTLC